MAGMTLLQTKLNSLAKPVAIFPSKLGPLKNATFVTMPSASLAEAVKVIVCGWMNNVLLVGNNQLTTGATLVRKLAVTLSSKDWLSTALL